MNLQNFFNLSIFRKETIEIKRKKIVFFFSIQSKYYSELKTCNNKKKSMYSCFNLISLIGIDSLTYRQKILFPTERFSTSSFRNRYHCRHHHNQYEPQATHFQ